MFRRGLTGLLLLETNLYFENAVLVLNPANYAFE
jgi:hypothetical protein